MLIPPLVLLRQIRNGQHPAAAMQACIGAIYVDGSGKPESCFLKLALLHRETNTLTMEICTE